VSESHHHDDHAESEPKHDDHGHGHSEESHGEGHGAEHGHGDAGHGDGGHHHEYSFVGSLAHHALPYPAWDVAHQPLLIFNSPAYSYKRIEKYKHTDKWDKAEPSDYQIEWAAKYLKKKGYDKVEIEAGKVDLATAMVVADSKATFGTFPASLSFVNHMTFFGTIALILVSLIVCVWGRRKPGQLKPANKLQHMLEAVTLYIRDEVVRPNVHHGDSWVPHFTAIFFAILAFNLLGLVPGTGAASAHFPITAAFAFTTLVTMLVFGMKAQGVGAYWKNLIPVPLTANPMDAAIWVILAIIEVAGLIIKPVALAIRLFANMFAGHAVILSFTSLFFIIFHAGAGDFMALGLGAFGMVLAVAIFLLKLLVAFIQAFVFTLLSAVFIGQSIHPDH
jgi:F-type H+-transporting ATPase subunit a